METIYVDRKGTRLQVLGNRLLMHVPERPRPLSMPMTQVRLLVITAGVDLGSSALISLSRHGVNLVLLNPMRPAAFALTLPYRHGAAERRVRQYEFIRDPELCLEAARSLVRAKLISQYRQLRRWRRQRADQRYALSRSMRAVHDRHRAAIRATAIDQLRGAEGAAAAAYFSALAALIAPSWKFTGRKRRPPPDPLNSLLSLTYTLLHAESLRALASAGLDPSLGFYHQLSYGRESLACDLMELVRADADCWVVTLLRTDAIRINHFEHQQSGACYLSKTGRKHFYPAWDEAARGWRRILRRHAQSWATSLGSAPESVEDMESTNDTEA